MIAFAEVVDQNKIIITKLKDVKHVVTVHDLETGKYLYDIPLPMGSMIYSLSCKKKDNYAFYNATSFLLPGVTYKFDFSTKEQIVFRQPDIKGLV